MKIDCHMHVNGKKQNWGWDSNASYNILRAGASTLGLGDVRPIATSAIPA